MDGFKNSTKMKYMCGGPVRKATGGAIKSVAPKGVMKSAASAKQLPTPEIAPKPRVMRAPPEAIREAPRPTMEPKRQVQPTPPKDVRTIGGAPKAPKKSPSGGTFTPWDNAPPKEAAAIQKKYQDAEKTMTPSAYKKSVENASRPATSPQDAKTIGGAPKAPKDVAGPAPRPTMEPKRPVKPTPPEPIREAPRPTMEPKRQVQPTPPTGAKTMAAPRGMGNAPAKAMAAPRGMSGAPAKAISSVSTTKRGVPVASKKPMIGFKTGGHVTKSSFKW